MGEHDERGSGLLPNGLVPNEAGTVMRVVGDGDSDRWLKAEKRTAQLIACIQPNSPSEDRRNAVAHYVQRLIRKCFPCEVFTFGSVPLKTYLPDGDIDLTAFSKNQNMKESWAHQVRDMLENEEKNENAEFHVKEVQYIQAEVKIIKCLVENIVVDISFNQLGGLCTLCFLEEVDDLIKKNHLFKRSIILIKAWCYYESRILGAHHGLISTYALETLVLYIFHVFNNSFAGPLEVLYRFLEFFSKFDWDNFCVSIWGPVPISSLPDVTAESPRKDGGELLLPKWFLDACSTAYAVHPGGQENQGQPFVSKHFNVIDPLRINNNLGRSVSKGNFFRIRSAFAFGAKRLARLLDCPKEDLVFEVNQFFLNTWDRHGSGHRPDAPRNDLWHLRLSAPDQIHVSESLRSNSSSQRNDIFSGHETQVGGTRGSGSVSSQHANHSLESSSRTSDVSTVSRTQSQKSYGNPNNSRVSDQIRWEISSNQGALVDKVQRISKPDNLVNDIQGKFLFARTRSSPELTDTYGEVSSQGRRNRGLESGKSQTSARFDNSRRKNQESDILASHSIRTEDPASVRHISSRQSLDAAADSNCGSNSYHEETGSGAMGEEFASVMGAQGMHQEEQDLVNMMASSATHNFNGQVHLPLNLASGHFPIPSSVLASMEHAQRNLSGMVPTNFPLFETPWGINMQFPQGFSSPLAHYFPGMGLTSNPEDSVEQPVNENFGSVEMSLGESDNDFWHEQDRGSTGGFDLDNGSFEMLQSDDKLQSTSASHKFDPSFHTVGSSSSTRNQQKITKENQGSMRDDHVDALQYQDNRGNEVYHDDRTSSSRSLPSATPSSVKSKTSSESSFEGSSVKVSKSTREKRGRRTAASVLPSTIVVKGKSTSEHSSTQGDDDNRDWNLPSTMGSELAERSTGAQSVAALHVTRHQVPGFESAQTSGSEPLIPIAPMLLGPGSRQRNPDGSSVPTYFYPTGPPVPFVAFPMYNFPTEAGTSDTSMSQFSGEEGLDNSDSSQNFDSSEGLDLREVLSTNSVRSTVPIEPLEHKSDILNSDFASHWQNSLYGRFTNSVRSTVPIEPLEHKSDILNSDFASNWQNSLYGRFTNSVRSTVPIEPLEHKSDILNSDFASHWQNLLYGRFCQNSRYPAPLIYPSPVMVPPVYLHGRFPSDGPGRPLSNANLFTQLMSYGPRFVPVAPLQSVSNRPAAVFPRYGDEIPRYRSGTGTYLPNPKLSARDRQSTGARRGNYNYDRSDHHGDREGNWNINSKSRAAGRSHSRTQAEKPNSRSDRLAASESRNDRPWGSHRRDSFPSHQSQNGPVRSNSAQSSPSNVTYGMCPLPTMNPSGVASNGPPLVMLYPYDHNAGGYGSHAEQLEFGSLGPVGLSGVNEVSQLNDGSQLSGAFEIHGVSAQRSSPDQPSSPHLRRSVTQRNYLLKEEDFPTLAFPNQGGNDSERSYDEKPSHFQTRGRND